MGRKAGKCGNCVDENKLVDYFSNEVYCTATLN